jgi:signal transduction histidine kinase
MVLVNDLFPFALPTRGGQPAPPPPPFLAQFPVSPSLMGATMAGLVQFCILLVVGTFIALLMQRLRAQRASLERANAQLANYASTLEHLAVSRERNRVARELHDTLAHTLTGMTVQLETMKAYWDVDHDAAHALLDQVLDASRNGVQETRRALKALRASPLDDLGLALAIRQLAESAAERAQLGLEVSVSETLPNLKPEVEQSIYRIAQEALENAAHHANAQNVYIKLEPQHKQLVLEIQDDGKGFDLNQIAPTGHYGIAGMQERAALIGAQLEISSQVGKGTRILLTV